MSAHSKGPWEVVAADRGFIITALDGCYDMAVVRNIGNQDNEANARLIAAAPDLLAALQAMIADNGFDEQSAAIIKASAAIQKATT